MIYENISYPMAERIIESTETAGRRDPFFDRAEESMLSMMIFYCKEVRKKTNIAELLLEVNNVLDNINSIHDFHKLLMSIEDESLRSVYAKSSFNATYSDYSEKSAGMTKEEASSENGWLLNGLNSTLLSLKYRFKRNGIKNIIQAQEIRDSLITKAEKIACGEMNLEKWSKTNLEYLSMLFKDVIDEKLGIEHDLNIIWLANDRLEREVSRRNLRTPHNKLLNFICKIARQS